MENIFEMDFKNSGIEITWHENDEDYFMYKLARRATRERYHKIDKVYLEDMGFDIFYTPIDDEECRNESLYTIEGVQYESKETVIQGFLYILQVVLREYGYTSKDWDIVKEDCEDYLEDMVKYYF